MASAPTPDRSAAQASAAVQRFAGERYAASGAARYGLDRTALAELLADVAREAGTSADEANVPRWLESLHLEELVLARACACGNEHAWEVFLTRYRTTLFESAYKIAGEDSAARGLADSLYAELYGVNEKGEQRTSKLLYYQGRGSLQGWLRVVVSQEYINRYRSAKRETSLDAAVEEGAQFAANEAESAVADPRIEKAVTAELAELDSADRFLLAAYFLDHRTLAEIAKLQRVHESTISRKLERATKNIRKRVRNRLIESGMSSRQADEVMQDVDVRDLNVAVRETLQQETPTSAFYKEKGESQG